MTSGGQEYESGGHPDGPPERALGRKVPGGMRTVIIVAVAVPVLAFLGILAWASFTSGPARGGLAVNNNTLELEVGAETAPGFVLPLMRGGEVSGEGLRGQVVMLDFWASWCPPCRDEAPTLALVYDEYRERGVEFVGISLWDDAGQAEAFVLQHGHEYPNGIDEGGKIAISYGVRGIPEKFFIDRDGRIVRKFSGPMTPDRLRLVLEAILEG